MQSKLHPLRIELSSILYAELVLFFTQSKLKPLQRVSFLIYAD